MNLSILALTIFYINIKWCLGSVDVNPPQCDNTLVKDVTYNSNESSEDLYEETHFVVLNVYNILLRLSNELDNELDNAVTEIVKNLENENNTDEVSNRLRDLSLSLTKSIKEPFKNLSVNLQSEVKEKFETLVKNAEKSIQELLDNLSEGIESKFLNMEDDITLDKAALLLAESIDKFVSEESKLADETSALFIAEVDKSLDTFIKNASSTLKTLSETLIFDINNLKEFGETVQKSLVVGVEEAEKTVSGKLLELVSSARSDIKVVLKFNEK